MAKMMGFVNALAILIFSAQIQYILGMSIMTYILVIAPLAIVYLLPYITNAVPATLVAILSLTAVVLLFGIDVQNVGNLGTISQTLPTFLIPDAPFNYLSKGVFVGIILSAIFFTAKISKITVEKKVSDDTLQNIYSIHG
jgi:MFS superfamily sulfate permease-like transporter